MQDNLTKQIINKLNKANIDTGVSFHVEILKDTNGYYNLYVTGEDTNTFKSEEFGVLESDTDITLLILNLLEQYI